MTDRNGLTSAPPDPEPTRAHPDGNNVSGDPPHREPVPTTEMHERYGGLLRAFFERLFGPIHYPDEYAERLHKEAQRAVVVYVTRGSTSWLALYFNFALSRLGLPLAGFVGGVSLLLWQPLKRVWQLWRHRRSQLDAGPLRERYGDVPPTRSETLLADTVLRGRAAFIALPRPHERGASSKARGDYFHALVAAQRLSERPIILAPHILAERSQGGGTDRGITERLFGDRRRPGRLRHSLMLFSTLRRATVRMADPIDLSQMVEEHPDTDDQVLARKVRHLVNRRMSDEERVILGGDIPDFAATSRHVLRNPLVQDAIAQQHRDTGKSEEQLNALVQSQLRAIAARYRTSYIKFLERILSWVFERIYDGLAVDQAGLARIVEASRRGPLILCPSHRSHVDYLVLSFLLWVNGLTPPHIAAGANLSFFPLGRIFRHSGAFFLRRSFKGDALYTAVFKAYVQELVRTGTSIEFFLEGTRSRTGKHLMPKFGLLSMVVDAWRAGARDDLQFVPVSIDYERIIEAGSYQSELGGAAKKREDLSGLLRTTSVLRSRYGRVQVQFGEPISLAELAEQRGLAQDLSAEHAEAWRDEVQRLGYRILHQVAMACSVTPTAVAATALLGHRARGISRSNFMRLCNAIVDYLEGAAARLSHTLQNPDSRGSAVLEAVRRMVDEGSVRADRFGSGDAEPIYRVPEERRVGLDFHKNSIINYFATASMVARAVLRSGADTVAYPQLHADCRFLSRLFKKEFLYRVDTDFDTNLDEALASLAVRGMVDVRYDDGPNGGEARDASTATVHVRDRQPLDMLAGLLDSFVEGYWITALVLRDLKAFPLWRRELVTRALERARRCFLEGNISRPEAANRTLVESALRWFTSAGAIEATPRGKRVNIRLAAGFSEGDLHKLSDDIKGFL